jgi:acetyl esterase/lipase
LPELRSACSGLRGRELLNQVRYSFVIGRGYNDDCLVTLESSSEPNGTRMKFRLTIVAASFLLATTTFAQDARRTAGDRPNSGPQRVTNWLAQQDKDKDGKIALAESTGLMKTHFRRNDTNSDGVLDRAELDQLAERLSRAANRPRRVRSGLSDEQVRQRAKDGVTVELNIAYREGNDAWKLDLARPSELSDAPRPAIVFVHGGGWRNGDKRMQNFMGPTLDYAARGYVCISVNYRLSGTKLSCIEDVKCAVRWLRAHADKYNVAPDRIGAYGNSAGAHLVAMLGVSPGEKRLEGDGPWQEYSSAVAAVAASATPTSPNVLRGSEEDKMLIAPMSYVSADAPPFLLFHEASDRTVAVSNSDDFVAALKKAGAKDISYRRYTDGSGHGVFARNAKETGPAMIQFFARTIGRPKTGHTSNRSDAATDAAK